MRILSLFFVFAAAAPIQAVAQGITDKNTQKEWNQMQKEKSDQQYKQYLKNKDAADGISQRTGPTGSIKKDGGSIGYQWSTR